MGCAVTIPWKSFELLYQEQPPLQIWKTFEYFNFERPWKAFSITFSFIFTLKNKQEASAVWRSKKSVLFISTFQAGGVPPILGTIISVHLKGIKLCFNILLGGRCICSIRRCHGYKYEQRKSKNRRLRSILLQVKYGGAPFIFSTCLFL